MAETSDELLAIEVDADDYAETAAGDTPSVSRTFQSEADFQAQKAAYTAKIGDGNNYEHLLEAVPALRPEAASGHGFTEMASSSSQVKLSKREGQLLGYAVGELYYVKKYATIIELCARVRDVCQVDEKVSETLLKWTRRCEDRSRIAETSH